MFTDIELCSKALAMIACEPINGFNDGTVEAEVAERLYPLIRDSLLSQHPWTFALGQWNLQRLTAKPVADFEYAFQLPEDLIRVVSLGPDGSGSGAQYRIHEKKIHCNLEQATLTGIFRADESTWPPFFAEVVIKHLAEAFASPLTENTTRKEVHGRDARQALKIAQGLDSQQKPGTAITSFALIDVRR